MNRTRFLSILPVLCVLPIAASCLSAEEKLTDLPVARVVLFSGGVAYFEHAGKIIGLRDNLHKMRKQAEELADRVRKLPESQTRLRENIKALAPSSPLVKRYVEKLSAQEDQLEKLEKDLADVKARMKLKEDEVLEFVKDLKVGKMPKPLPGERRPAGSRGSGIF